MLSSVTCALRRPTCWSLLAGRWVPAARNAANHRERRGVQEHRLRGHCLCAVLSPGEVPPAAFVLGIHFTDAERKYVDGMSETMAARVIDKVLCWVGELGDEAEEEEEAEAGKKKGKGKGTKRKRG